MIDMCKKCNDYEEYEQDSRKITDLDHILFGIILFLLSLFAIISYQIK